MSVHVSNVIDVKLSIENTLGACLVGFAAACIIYGVLLTMVYTYFQRYPEDRAIYKYLTIAMVLLETADQIFIAHLIYYYGIINFANPAALLKGNMTWSLIMQLLVGSIVGFLVKTAFAVRVWRFSERNYWITGFLLLLTFGHLGAAILYSVRAFQLTSLLDVANLQLYGTISLAVGVGTDVLIAASLCFYIRRLRTGYRPSDSLVNQLVRLAVNTGVVTGAVSLTTLILYNIMPHNNLIFVATYFILSKLYAISFLATLNTRRVIRGRGTDRNASNTAGGSRDHGRHSNMFALGTRAPSMTGADIENWQSPSSSAKTPSFQIMTPSPIYGGGRPDLALDTGYNKALSEMSPSWASPGVSPGQYKSVASDQEYFYYPGAHAQ
ncbi:hypothetical protein DL96DRAFT_1598072 [Flagelloscypha sp. PMI_526]|nr:hypothetical protein DL96DRAFT_1598072 [Flagelloscypha sp. PMI_526]